MVVLALCFDCLISLFSLSLPSPLPHSFSHLSLRGRPSLTPHHLQHYTNCMSFSVFCILLVSEKGLDHVFKKRIPRLHCKPASFIPLSPQTFVRVPLKGWVPTVTMLSRQIRTCGVKGEYLLGLRMWALQHLVDTPTFLFIYRYSLKFFFFFFFFFSFFLFFFFFFFFTSFLSFFLFCLGTVSVSLSLSSSHDPSIFPLSLYFSSLYKAPSSCTRTASLLSSR